MITEKDINKIWKIELKKKETYTKKDIEDIFNGMLVSYAKQNKDMPVNQLGSFYWYVMNYLEKELGWDIYYK